MSLDRGYLWLSGLSFVVFGLAYLVAPVAMAALTELGVETATARIDIRGYYGGQLLGLGALVLLGAMRDRYRVPALLVIAASIGGTGVGRIVGIVAAGEAPAFMLGAAAVEVAMAAFALVLCRRPSHAAPVGLAA